MIQVEHVVKWIQLTHQKIVATKDKLTELDQAIGDGDHGINLARGLDAAIQNLSPDESKEDLGEVFQKIGMALIAKVGGASGALYGSAFVHMAKVCKGKKLISLAELAQVIEAGAMGIKARGRAEVGDKTMLDIWQPLADYLNEHIEKVSWEKVQQFLFEQMEKTKELVAKKGRAAFLESRSIGHLDPGAVSSTYLFIALCETLDRGE
ncbi:dihydroxyacetone kinase subunit DhaL [Thermoflavimicrobium daqui]|uniref:dihydroxyacetone kinase subunit DhaL n=1 Tax=Thermoflavimicrobium daqui TaxID=2137476 RepID=UPI001F0CCA0D|nr:dihydroxyacetone kinase subunit DhaL [Thermoflavimicrobium daqui]